MQRKTLGDSELLVSSIGMGCVTFGREIDRADSFAVLDRALERGINLFDTAEAYAQGASEDVLGAWLADRGVRDEVVIATKVSGQLDRERVMRSAEDSARRLGVDEIDLFQLHIWDDATPLEDTIDGLNRLVESGLVRYVGCSNWSAWQLAKGLLLSARTGLVRMQSVQPPYNLAQREIEADLLPLCADQNIGVLSYSPLGAGFLSGKYGRGERVPEGTRFDVIPGHQPIYFTDHGYRVLDRLTSVAEETGHSMVQLALSWTLNQPGITSVLIGARNTDQVDQAFLAEQIDAADVACLTE